VRSGRHAAGALDAAVFRLERAGMRLRLWAAERGARLDRFGAPPAAGAGRTPQALRFFKMGRQYTVDVEVLKRALRELVEREPSFLRDLVLEALRSDGGAAEALLDLFTKHPEAKLKLAQAVAGAVAIPLNVATKEDLKRLATKQDLEELKKWAEEKFATKEDLKRIEDKMATKEQFEAIAVSVEDSGRDMVQYLLEQRGYRCAAERLRLDADYELDIYCNAGAVTAVGEAKVRAGRRDVEKTLERAQELLRRWPDKISGRLVPVLYSLVAEPSAVQRAKELKVWLIESRREAVALEEVL
jgi:hypothetical protein